MKIYTVGGAVRDELLGLPVKDRDYVVVGATPDEMVALGYKPVGRDFPVFLHPQTHEEYALARTERKTAPGYHGFTFHAAPDVTLEQDLARRDLTINAIARGEDGKLIDPFNGEADIRARVFRHEGAPGVKGLIGLGEEAGHVRAAGEYRPGTTRGVPRVRRDVNQLGDGIPLIGAHRPDEGVGHRAPV